MQSSKSVLILLSFLFCYKSHAQIKTFDIQGHRGCRGNMPENSIPAFIRALEYGVTTLELDVVISFDKKIVISHEPWINKEICLDPAGRAISLDHEMELNMYRMNYAEIREYICGKGYFARFPEQEKIVTYKPLLSEMIDSVKKYCSDNYRDLPQLNIEIKSDTAYDGKYSPPVIEFCELVLSELINQLQPADFTIQSFDNRVMKYIHKQYPQIRLVYLSESVRKLADVEKEIGFLPETYSPAKELVSKRLIKECHDKKVKIIPWTVNSEKQMKKFVKWEVDGIISDYPLRLINLLNLPFLSKK